MGGAGTKHRRPSGDRGARSGAVRVTDCLFSERNVGDIARSKLRSSVKVEVAGLGSISLTVTTMTIYFIHPSGKLKLSFDLTTKNISQ